MNKVISKLTFNNFLSYYNIASINVLEAKANGLTFDPFGSFMASQSSEDKNLIIWRV